LLSNSLETLGNLRIFEFSVGKTRSVDDDGMNVFLGGLERL